MSSPRFKAFIPFILEHECVYSKGHYGDLNHIIIEDVPGDSGGRTFAGIDESSHPNFNFEHPTLEAAEEVYFAEWTKQGIEDLPANFGESFFDCSVNAGLGRSLKIVKASGRDWRKFNSERILFYRRLAAARPSLRKFLKGWIQRVTDLNDYLERGSK